LFPLPDTTFRYQQLLIAGLILELPIAALSGKQQAPLHQT
jgi:hypothetical protein